MPLLEAQILLISLLIYSNSIRLFLHPLKVNDSSLSSILKIFLLLLYIKLFWIWCSNSDLWFFFKLIVGSIKGNWVFTFISSLKVVSSINFSKLAINLQKIDSIL